MPVDQMNKNKKKRTPLYFPCDCHTNVWRCSLLLLFYSFSAAGNSIYCDIFNVIAKRVRLREWMREGGKERLTQSIIFMELFDWDRKGVCERKKIPHI